MKDSDLENAFRGLNRTELVNSAGVAYSDYRASLTPRYVLVWIHVLCGYVALIGLGFGIVYVEQRVSLPVLPLVALAGAFLFGYTIHFLHLFMHEGSHFNLARNKDWNDRLANVFIGILVGMHMKPYRPTHLDHHRFLGTPRDTEISYFDPLNTLFILESVLGIRVFKTLINRNKVHRVKGIRDNKYDRWLAYRALLFSAMFHGAVILFAFLNGWYVLLFAWAGGACAFYPFLGSLRTLLEHRSEEASKDVDYRKESHGKINRMFGVGPVALTFGHAGFNRHLLHHMEPQISYTRLRELEHFLMDTDWGKASLDRFRTTYSRTFMRLYNR
ncbi:MAG: fatty acid desaturase [Candidatus Hydrogenedentota bacterium]|nr:MAG: fatty acid desaturase [Candidatus Hydrogenedentota bacterium]